MTSGKECRIRWSKVELSPEPKSPRLPSLQAASLISLHRFSIHDLILVSLPLQLRRRFDAPVHG